jgi:hypothetical protein
MFADYLPSMDFSNEIHDHTVKDHPSSFGTEQNPILANKSDQDRLVSSQEKNTSPHAGDGPLSRDSQDRRITGFVN